MKYYNNTVSKNITVLFFFAKSISQPNGFSVVAKHDQIKIATMSRTDNCGFERFLRVEKFMKMR